MLAAKDSGLLGPNPTYSSRLKLDQPASSSWRSRLGRAPSCSTKAQQSLLGHKQWNGQLTIPDHP